jgi:signal transduction histidine kinase
MVTVRVRRVLREPFTARAWRRYAYCLCQPFFDLFGFVLVAVLVTLSVVSFGVLALPLLPLMLAFARGLGSMHRGLAHGLLDVEILEPVRQPRRRGVLGFIGYHFGDSIGWRATGYLLAKLLLLIVEFAVGGVFPLGLPLMLISVIGSRQLAAAILFVVWTGLFLVAPWLTNLVLKLDILLMRRLLGPSEDSLRIRELEQTRSHAINEAASTLRRIERDLHDGAQARLVALGMQLGRAERQLERGNTDSGMALLRSSRDEARAIVQDLRDMVRGIHPPALDSGLEPALSTLAAKTPIATSVRVMVADRLPAAAETMLYFAAAELLTNAAKHSDAQSVAITVVGDAHADVQLIVTDDGRGGASLNGAGSGLRGLAERIRVVDGQLSVLSPVGGPTTITVWLPGTPSGAPQEGN